MDNRTGQNTLKQPQVQASLAQAVTPSRAMGHGYGAVVQFAQAC